MRRLFSKVNLRDLSLIMVVVWLFAGVSATAGFVVVYGPSQPELTINICQPIQMFDRVSNVLLARPATVLPEFALCDLGSTAMIETVLRKNYRRDWKRAKLRPI